jgi:hypothetical protein
MSVPSRPDLEAYVRRWKTLGPLLEELREEQIRNADTVSSVLAFEQAFRIARRDLPPRESSGLVEWAKLALRWGERG